MVRFADGYVAYLEGLIEWSQPQRVSSPTSSVTTTYSHLLLSTTKSLRDLTNTSAQAPQVRILFWCIKCDFTASPLLNPHPFGHGSMSVIWKCNGVKKILPASPRKSSEWMPIVFILSPGADPQSDSSSVKIRKHMQTTRSKCNDKQRNQTVWFLDIIVDV